MEPQKLAAYKAVAAEIDELIACFMPLVGCELPVDVFRATLLALSHRAADHFDLAAGGSILPEQIQTGTDEKSVEALRVKYH